MADMERSEAPTPRRRERARDEGDVLKSRDVSTALVVLAGVAWLAWFGPSLLAACKAVMAAALNWVNASNHLRGVTVRPEVCS